MLASLFAVLAPVFIVAGIGYGWARSGIDYPTEFIAQSIDAVMETLFEADLSPDEAAEDDGDAGR